MALVTVSKSGGRSRERGRFAPKKQNRERKPDTKGLDSGHDPAKYHAGGMPTMPTPQAKLIVGEPHDKFEREADRVADLMMQMPERSLAGASLPAGDAPGSRSAGKSGPAAIQRVCAECEADDGSRLQRALGSTLPGRPRGSVFDGPSVGQIEPWNSLLAVQRHELGEDEADVLRSARRSEPVQRQVEDEDESLRAKSRVDGALRTTSQVEATVRGLRGGGQVMPTAERDYFEPRFGRDLSQVRVHTDRRASESADAINARAFTVGRNIAFGAGQYVPGSSEGRRLLAHELTHVIQQVGGGMRPRRSPAPSGAAHGQLGSVVSRSFATPAARGRVIGVQRDPRKPGALVIRRVPSTTPHGRRYVPGVSHRHAPAPGNWARVQTIAAASCGAGTTSVLDDLRRRRVPSLPSLRSALDCVCARSGPAYVLRYSRARIASMPLARAHLSHFETGSGADYRENVDDFIRRDASVRGMISRRARGTRLGSIRVIQRDYGEQDFQFAFGAIDHLSYEHRRAAGTVHVWFQDFYEFHPVYPGIYTRRRGDGSGRGTNCVHAAAVELTGTSASADNFWMWGHQVFPESLFGLGGRRRRRTRP